MPQTCPSCRVNVNPNDAFCPSCGFTLRSSAEQRTVTSQPAARPRQHHPGAYHPQSRQARQRSRPWFRKKRFIFPLVFLMLLGAGGVTGMWVLNNAFGSLNELSTPSPEEPAGLVMEQVNEGNTDDLGLADLRDPGGDSVTVLLMGVDARPGEPIDIGVRPDSLQVLHISGDGGTCRTLSIPRDTRTDLPGYGQSKINHALSVGGIPYQALVVEQLLGIEIDHFGLIDFAGLVGVVDAIGGVTVTNQRAFELEGMVFPEGPQTLSGEQALNYARFRGDSEGDFGRQRRQQEIIRGVLEQTGGLDAARAVPAVMRDIDGHFKTDLRVTSLVGLANDFRSTCTSASLESAGLEGAVGNDWDELYNQELSFVHVDGTEIDAKTSWLLGETAASQLAPVAAITNDRRETRS
jgi:polyisoprenyl-teichoic acid--peptidoglycan teichoic acid transferase